MIRKKARRFALSLCVMSLALAVSGCEQNVFKGLVKDTTPKDTKTLIESGNYTEAIQKADEVINNSASTTEQKQNAYVDKGTALLGKNNVEFANILSVVSDLTKDTIDTQSVFNKTKEVLPISVTDAQDSADAFNLAYELGLSSHVTLRLSSSLIGTNSIIASLNETTQYRRGVANATVVIKMATRYLDINNDGSNTSATLNALAVEENKTWVDVLLYLSNPPKEIFYYASNAYEGFKKSNALTESQLTTIKKLVTVSRNIKNLRAAYLSSSTFTVVDFNNQPTGIYSSPRAFNVSHTEDDMLRECLTEIVRASK